MRIADPTKGQHELTFDATKHIQYNDEDASNYCSSMGFADVLVDHSRSKVMATGYIAIHESKLSDPTVNDLPQGLTCTDPHNPITDCNVEFGDATWEMAVFEFDYNLDLKKLIS